MKVAIVASLLRSVSPDSAGGTEVFAHVLNEGLIDKGVDTTLFATSDSLTSGKLASVCSSQQTTGVFEGPVAGNVVFEALQAIPGMAFAGIDFMTHRVFVYKYLQRK